MGKIKFLIGLLAIIITVAVMLLVLNGPHALVTNPKGLLAHKELKLIITNVTLMLLIIVPTFLLVVGVPFLYRANNQKRKHEPEKKYGPLKQLIFWLIPTVIVAVMSVITWRATYDLDPYKPIESSVTPLKIEVMAINWKWLFIYPEQGIAAINYVQFPEKTPIRFELAADNSPMNSFWIPQLSGQIYSMTGMITPLHIMADGPGIYSGKAAEINGEGYASMRFKAESVSKSDFESWVEEVRKGNNKLTHEKYEVLLKPSINNPVELYSDVEKNLFNDNVMKYMHHNHDHNHHH